MNVQLSYDTPAAPTPTIWLHRTAQLCGVLPLTFGTFIFALFLLTRNHVYAIFGAFTILGGVCMAFIGIVCALVYLYQASRAAPIDRDPARRRAHRDIRIILANFLVAAVMTWIGTAMMSHF